MDPSVSSQKLRSPDRRTLSSTPHPSSLPPIQVAVKQELGTLGSRSLSRVSVFPAPHAIHAACGAFLYARQMPALKNSRWEALARGLAEGMARNDAFIAAGFNPKNKRAASAQCANLLRRSPEIMARVTELETEIRESATLRAEINRGYVLTGLKENHARAMEQEPVLDRDGNPTGEYKYAGTVANRALELMGKELGMFADRLILDDLDSELEKMSGDELKSYVRAIAGEVGLRVVDMNHDQIRQYIVTHAPRVGLRVEDCSQDPHGAENAEGADVQSVPEAEGVPPARRH